MILQTRYQNCIKHDPPPIPEGRGTLTFRRSCAHGVRGSDAMRINGHNRLAWAGMQGAGA